MSYFARLREQSELKTLTGDSERDADLRSDLSAAMNELKITEIVESRAAEHVAALPARSAEEAAVRRELPLPVSDTESPSSKSLVAEASPSQRVEPPPEIHPVPPSQVSRAAAFDIDVNEEAEPAPISAETTLHHVFEWIAAVPCPVEERVTTPIKPIARTQATKAPSVAVPAIRPIAISLSEPASPAHGLPVSHAESVKVETVDTQGERRPHTPVAVPQSVEHPGEDANVEEMLTVSIGTIHVCVEAPAPAPPVVALQSAPVRPPRAERRAAPRLARHYLRS